MDDFSYLGSGKILMREYGAAAPFEEVGNCSVLTFSPQTNTISLPDYTAPGGGARNSVDRVTSVDTSYTFHDFAAANFARALRGSVTEIQAGDAVDEPVVAYIGGSTPLARQATLVASVEAVGGATTYDEGDDYQVRDGMLYIPEGSSIPAPVDGAANLSVSYSYGAFDKVEALVNPAKQYELLFVGLNEARSGKAVRVHAHKVSGGMIQQMALLGDEYGAGEVPGQLLADTTKGAGLSKYFTVEIER